MEPGVSFPLTDPAMWIDWLSISSSADDMSGAVKLITMPEHWIPSSSCFVSPRSGIVPHAHVEVLYRPSRIQFLTEQLSLFGPQLSPSWRLPRTRPRPYSSFARTPGVSACHHSWLHTDVNRYFTADQLLLALKPSNKTNNWGLERRVSSSTEKLLRPCTFKGFQWGRNIL